MVKKSKILVIALLSVLIIILLIIIYFPINPESKISNSSINSTIDIDMAGWKTFTEPTLHFSIKYPSDILSPSFNNINPDSPTNKAEINIPGIDKYMNNAYKTRGFDNLGGLNVGFLYFRPESRFVNQKYMGINFAVYYFDKEIKLLSDTFGSNKDFYFSKINGVTVGVLDHTKKSDGTPLSYAKFYFIKNKTDLLQISTFIPAEFASKEDKKRVFELFENVLKTISF